MPISSYKKDFKRVAAGLALCSILTPSMASAADSGNLKIGGAVRYNFFSKSWLKNPDATQATWDTWRINVDRKTKNGIDLSFEYRFYPTSDASFIHHGYLGYALDKDLYGKIGVFQKPFGITPYASHSWFFQTPYYVGLEDDYDMGAGLDWKATDKLKVQLAYFRQAEPHGTLDNDGGSDEASRYSYDVVTTGTGAGEADLRELNTVNLRLAYKLTPEWEIGASGQVGEIYNNTTRDSETAYAVAAHLLGNIDHFNVKAEFVNYDYKARNNDGVLMSAVPMGAYGSIYNVAAKANMYVAGVAYDVPVEFGPVTNLQFYVDYTYTQKLEDGFEDTQQLVPGVLVTAGPVYTYIDVAMGKNHPWIGGDWNDGLASGDANAKWETRFNVNVGYYF